MGCFYRQKQFLKDLKKSLTNISQGCILKLHQTSILLEFEENMKITQEGDYALRVVLYLSKKGVGEKVEAKVMAEDANIPLRFLLKLLRKLTVAGILNSFRGIGGGYAVARAPGDITLYDVIDAIDGPLYINRCLYDKAYCTLNRTDTCEVHSALGKIQARLFSELKSVTFENLISGDGKSS